MIKNQQNWHFSTLNGMIDIQRCDQKAQ